MANHFLVFIGGTGAKCAEAFVQLAAAGAVGDPSQTFHLLTLDVDATNGNRKLAIEAIERYSLLREQFPATGPFQGSSLFGPEIRHYDWPVRLPDTFPHAAGANCLNAMRTQNSAEEEALMRLFYTDEELGFDFSREGFHAIPAIGAPVMQYILSEGRDLGGFTAFADAMRSEVSAHSHLIVVGSIFGGTGACGLPAVMRALADQTRRIALAGTLHAHAVLLLPYYHFAEPGAEDELGVHSRKFYNNARGALAFYRDMERELNYESLYLLGAPVDFNMGAYRPGMETQQNPPTPVEWESALAIAHCLEQGSSEAGQSRQYVKGVRGAGPGETAQRLSLDWADLSLPIRDRVGTMARFVAAYLGYYRPYIAAHAGEERNLRPFYQELLRPYVDRAETEHKGLAALAAFCARTWDWLRASLSYEALEQTCFTERMMLSGNYPYKALHALIRSASAPRWTSVEDALFDGIRPLAQDEEAYPQRSAGLFVHGLYAHCAP